MEKIVVTVAGYEIVNNTVIWDPGEERIATLWTIQGKKLQTLKGHRDAIVDVSFSPDGKTIATASNDKTVKLWNLQGKELRTLRGHREAVSRVKFSPKGQAGPAELRSARIATGSGDATIKLWDLNGAEQQTLKGHRGIITSLDFSPDGKQLATLSLDNSVKLWRLDSQIPQPMTWRTEYVPLSFSSDGTLIATGVPDDPTFTRSDTIHQIKLWKVSGQQLATLKFPGSPLLSIHFSPDRKTLATAHDDNTVRLWTLSGQNFKTFKGFSTPVWEMSFSPDGKILAMAQSPYGNANIAANPADRDNTVRLWNLEGQPIGVLKGHQNAVTGISFSPDGQTLATASADRTLKLWNLKGQELKTLGGHSSPIRAMQGSIG